MRPSRHDTLTRTSCVFLLLLPWLNPFTPDPDARVVQSLVSLSCLALLLAMPLWQVGGDSLARVAAPAWLLAALLSCLLALLQYFGASEALAPWVNSTDVGKAFANLRQSNHFATLTAIGLAVLLFRVQREPPSGLSSRSLGRPPFWHVVICLLAAALLGIGNAASSSRTGFLELLLLALLMLLWKQWRHPVARRVMLAAGVGYASAALARLQLRQPTKAVEQRVVFDRRKTLDWLGLGRTAIRPFHYPLPGSALLLHHVQRTQSSAALGSGVGPAGGYPFVWRWPVGPVACQTLA